MREAGGGCMSVRVPRQSVNMTVWMMTRTNIGYTATPGYPDGNGTEYI